jgi:hypothetical protein
MMDDRPEPSNSKALIFTGLYVLMCLVSFAVHLWVTVRGWSADGMWWGLLYLGFFVYAELYWSFRAFASEGPSIFVLASGLCGLWWVVLLLFRKKLSTWVTGAGKGEHAAVPAELE